MPKRKMQLADRQVHATPDNVRHREYEAPMSSALYNALLFWLCGLELDALLCASVSSSVQWSIKILPTNQVGLENE